MRCSMLHAILHPARIIVHQSTWQRRRLKKKFPQTTHTTQHGKTLVVAQQQRIKHETQPRSTTHITHPRMLRRMPRRMPSSTPQLTTHPRHILVQIHQRKHIVPRPNRYIRHQRHTQLHWQTTSRNHFAGHHQNTTYTIRYTSYTIRYTTCPPPTRQGHTPNSPKMVTKLTRKLARL